MLLCDNAEKCPIYTKREQEQWRSRFAKEYCEGDPTKCVRREIRLRDGIEKVPKDMLPNGLRLGKSVYE